MELLSPVNQTLMASQKVRPTALRRFFRTSTYYMYAFAPEKPPSLVGRNFCLAIVRVFAKASNIPSEKFVAEAAQPFYPDPSSQRKASIGLC
jgi:hypothetical protein